MKTYQIDTGREVVCDICNKDWTDSPKSGGIYGFSTKAICPDCTPGFLKTVEECGELRELKAVCPNGKSFADWVRDDLRA